MNCQKVRRVIEATDRGDFLNAEAAEHIKGCPACEKLNEEHLELRNITANLGTVEAPADFDFRLRARLARANAEDVSPGFGRLTFGLRGAALASLLVVFGGAMLIVNLRTSENPVPNPVAEKPAPNEPIAAATPFQPTLGSPGLTTPGLSKDPIRASSSIKRGRTGTRDMASGRAPVVRPNELTARASDFPIDASSQPVKVSLDDGRGSSRTISVPTVSFGSQRVLSQSNSPLVASARGAW
ncbi:MAG TPA: hypothetical protein VJU84_13720 [Pyrinomonadaceae bacterium]|nr:hypothetical protein [Pyrinomonadaceae bacterium]